MAKYSISYIYQIIDKYSQPLRRIAKATNKAKESFKKVNRHVLEFGKTLRDIGVKATLFATTPILLMGRSMIKAASDAEETRSKFATVFREIGADAENIADTFAKSFGLAGTKARELLGNTGDMLVGFGFSEKAAFDLARQTNELAVDLASFTNFAGGAEGASAALTKALLGERESVKSLGIAILEEDVKKKIAILRARGMRFETERQAKAIATLQIAIDQSQKAIGDYARTKQSYANIVRRVSSRLQDVSESFGRILLPVAKRVMIAIEGLLIRFEGLDERIKKIIIIVASFVAVAGPLILILGTISLILPVLSAGVGILAGAFAILTGPIGIAIAVLGALVAAFRVAYNHNQAFRDAIDNMAVSVKAAFSSMRNFLSPIFEWLNDWFVRISDFITRIGGNLLRDLGFDFSQTTVSNVAALSAANQNTLNGEIAITANNATVDRAQLETSAPGNLGMNLAGAR